MIKIPTFQNISADFQQSIELEGQLVIIRLKYNIRNEFFSMDFTDQNGNIIRGIKLVGNWLLLKAFKGSTDFRGDIIVIKDENIDIDDVTYDSLNNGWDFYYLNDDEVTEWELNNGIG